jgi:hypothetical protein
VGVAAAVRAIEIDMSDDSDDDDLLSRAQNETANALTPGQWASSTSGATPGTSR